MSLFLLFFWRLGTVVKDVSKVQNKRMQGTIQHNLSYQVTYQKKKKKKQKSELPNCFSTMTKYMCGNSYTINITYKFFTHLTDNTWPHKEKFVKLTCCLILMSTKAAKPAFPVPTSDLNTSEQTISTSN